MKKILSILAILTILSSCKDLLSDVNNKGDLIEVKLSLTGDVTVKEEPLTKAFDSNDLSIVDSFLKKYQYSANGLTVLKKYIVNSQDSIYIVSNYPSSVVRDSNHLFYIVFYRKKDKNYLLVNRGYLEGLQSYNLSWVLDIDSGYYNFILSYDYGEGICYDMYEYIKGKYVKVIGTNEE